MGFGSISVLKTLHLKMTGKWLIEHIFKNWNLLVFFSTRLMTYKTTWWTRNKSMFRNIYVLLSFIWFRVSYWEKMSDYVYIGNCRKLLIVMTYRLNWSIFTSLHNLMYRHSINLYPSVLLFLLLYTVPQAYPRKKITIYFLYNFSS